MTCKDPSGSWFVVVCGGLEPIEAAPMQDTSAAQTHVVVRWSAPDERQAGAAEEVLSPSREGGLNGPTRAAETIYVLVTDDAALGDLIRRLLRVAGLEMASFSRVEDCLRVLERDVSRCGVIVGEATAMCTAAWRESAHRFATVPVVALTEPNDLPAAIEAMKAGAFDVMEKTSVEKRLLDVVTAALAEQRARQQQHQACLELRRRYAELTAREREVLHLVAAGLRSRAIAARLGIREKTVEVYRSRVNHKMNARNAVELAQMLRALNL